MNYKKKLPEIIAELTIQAQKIQSLAEELSELDNAINADLNARNAQDGHSEHNAHSIKEAPVAVPPKINNPAAEQQDMLFSKGIGLKFNTPKNAPEGRGIKPSPRITKEKFDPNLKCTIIYRRGCFKT
jgi:hypothetical protein